MLRRFRERRALRAAEKQANKKNPSQNVPSINNKSVAQQPIFRSVGLNIPSIQETVTMGLSADEDEAFNEVASPKVVLFDSDKVKETKIAETYDWRNIMDTDLQDFESDIADIDEKLFSASIELGFMKETLTVLENELKKSQTKVDRQNIEITIARIALKYQEEELRYVKSSLEAETTTRKELQSTLESTQALLQSRDDEIKTLKNSVQLCNRSAQMLAGFLTLGAMISTEK